MRPASGRRDDQLGQRVAQAVMLQEPVERLALVGAERERRRLRHDARVERRRLEHAGERPDVVPHGEERRRRERPVSRQNPVQILNQQGQVRQLEPAMHRLPVEPPDRPIRRHGGVHRGEVRGHERRIGPVEQPRRQAVVLRGDEDLPVVDRRAGEVGPGVADEAPEDVLLELGLRVRPPGAAELVEAGEQRPAWRRPRRDRYPCLAAGPRSDRARGVVWAIRSLSEWMTTSRIGTQGYEVHGGGSRKAEPLGDLSAHAGHRSRDARGPPSRRAR